MAATRWFNSIFPNTMLNNLPSFENIALPNERQSIVSNLQLVDESSTKHGVMPPSYCANNYGSSCQNVHRRNGPNLIEHQILMLTLMTQENSLKHGILEHQMKFVAIAKPYYGMKKDLSSPEIPFRQSSLFCCREGKVRLPPLRDAPDFLRGLLDYSGGRRTRKFKENIRPYNSMFTFTSTGGTVDREINNGGGPYVYRINGQNHHRIGSLLPPAGRSASFAQLYIYI
ncbi:UNVERIFIED_CONTAM: hypothetical protein Sradi_4384800 [Sesamum radiatum]|uniref:Uncharacterized protein n=1 Tax=Sesamum radiatum TaxID=300843 RepID=A0AAW2NRG5_SESRA